MRTLALGTVLRGRYQIIRPIGTGGMGAVYEAIDLRLQNTSLSLGAAGLDDAVNALVDDSRLQCLWFLRAD